MLILFTLIFGIGSLGLAIYALVVFFQEPKAEKSACKIGAIAATYLIISEILIITITPEALGNFPNPLLIVFQDGLAAFKTFVITVVGIKLSREFRFRWSAFDKPKLKNFWTPLFLVVTGTTALVTFSYFFLKWQNPSMGMFLANLETNTKPSIAEQFSATLGVLEFAVFEELAYRSGLTLLLYRILPLEKSRYLISALLATLFWTLSHYGSLDPSWVKFVQVLPLGLFCAWLARKFGIEYAILAHAIFNVAFVFLELDLLPTESPDLLE